MAEKKAVRTRQKARGFTGISQLGYCFGLLGSIAACMNCEARTIASRKSWNIVGQCIPAAACRCLLAFTPYSCFSLRRTSSAFPGIARCLCQLSNGNNMGGGRKFIRYPIPPRDAIMLMSNTTRPVLVGHLAIYVSSLQTAWQVYAIVLSEPHARHFGTVTLDNGDEIDWVDMTGGAVRACKR